MSVNIFRLLAQTIGIVVVYSVALLFKIDVVKVFSIMAFVLAMDSFIVNIVIRLLINNLYEEKDNGRDY